VKKDGKELERREETLKKVIQRKDKGKTEVRKAKINANGGRKTTK
jgi:hypothetical protein